MVSSGFLRFLEELIINYTKVLLEGIDILYSFAKRTVNAQWRQKGQWAGSFAGAGATGCAMAHDARLFPIITRTIGHQHAIRTP